MAQEETKNTASVERLKSEFDAFLSRLVAEKECRWLALGDFPPNYTKVFFENVCARFNGQATWLLLDQLFQKDIEHDLLRNPDSLVVIDCYERTEREATTREIKTVLQKFPEHRFILVGGGALVRNLPSYYGAGYYIGCTEEFVADAALGEHAEETAILQHARKLVPSYHLSDLVLGPKAMLKFNEALSYIRSKSYCEKNWGFRKRHSRGHGVTLLFNGPSGTGKTMAAEVVASEVDFPLYQIDLSSVVSKWIGETEKNLKSIFAAARGTKSILLFDEGDAIFGARTEVKSSQDRYGNLEVNYLLQEIERFDGIVILSTNHFKNMDPAFLRRFTYTIGFGYPAQAQRLFIWKRNCPPEMPLAANVDFEMLSGFALTGGNIKNCIRDAAAIAADKRKVAVEQVDFLWALKRELQKHDIVLTREQLGEEYWRKIGTEWEHLHFGRKAPEPAAMEDAGVH